MHFILPPPPLKKKTLHFRTFFKFRLVMHPNIQLFLIWPLRSQVRFHVDTYLVPPIWNYWVCSGLLQNLSPLYSSLLHYGRKLLFFLFLFKYDVEPHQSRVLWTHPLKVNHNPQIHDLTYQNHVSSNPKKFLMGIEFKMSGSTTHPKASNIRLNSNEYYSRELIKNEIDKLLTNGNK